LAILDLSQAGAQPMFSENQNIVLVFNGEIFNYVELRDILKTRGHYFRSSGDAEVLLHCYEEWGTEFLHKLNGMWSFLIYDVKKKIVFGSRDRFGVKPFYQYRTKDLVLFGSEIKSILHSGLNAYQESAQSDSL